MYLAGPLVVSRTDLQRLDPRADEVADHADLGTLFRVGGKKSGSRPCFLNVLDDCQLPVTRQHGYYSWGHLTVQDSLFLNFERNVRTY